MEVKTYLHPNLLHTPARNLVNLLMKMMLVFMVVSLSSTSLFGQTLNTDVEMPTLDACGAPQVFTVKIARGNTACDNGSLTITLPAGIEYIATSAKVDGITVEEAEVTPAGATLSLPQIPAGSSTEEVVITFEVQARCEALELSEDDREVQYVFSGCGELQSASSNTINLNYAVLNVEVEPAISSGIIGTTIERTITVVNSGNGATTGFVLPATYGDGIERVSAVLPDGVTWDESTSAYTFSGNVPASATVISFRETVQITEGCGDLTTSYRAYYGCDEECEAGAGEPANPVINFDTSIRPRLTISAENPVIECFGQEYTHTWTITNDGDGIASNIDVIIGTERGGGASYIGQVTGGDISEVIETISNTNFDTQGEATKVRVRLPVNLEPGESTTLEFDQFYAIPTTEDCTQLGGSLNTGTTYREAMYEHLEGCDGDGNPPTYAWAKEDTKGNITYSFSGQNVGEIDIVRDIPYQADFRLDNLSIPAEGLGDGAYFEFTITLSDAVAAGFNSSDIRLFNGTDYVDASQYVVAGSRNTFTLRINRGTTIWPADEGLNLGGGAWRLQFPLSVDCENLSDPWYTIEGGFSKGGACTEQPIPFGCTTVSLIAHCGEGDCSDGGLSRGPASLQRISLGYADANNDGLPDGNDLLDPNGPLTNIQTRSFIGGDIVEISQTGTALGGDAMPNGGWTNGTFTVTSPNNLGAAEIIEDSGKIIITRGSDTYTITGLPVTTGLGNTYSVSLAVEDFVSVDPTLPTDFAYQDGDVIVTSLQIRPMALDATNELKVFDTNYYFLDENGDERSCGTDYHATGYYGSTSLGRDQIGNGDVTGCDFSDNGYVINFSIGNRNTRNALFINEFRQIAIPKSINFQVPSGLQMTGYRIVLQNNSPGSVSPHVQTIQPVSGSTHTISENDIRAALETIKGGSDGLHLDEGFRMIVYPIVTPLCAASDPETIVVTSVVNGTFRYNNNNYYGEDVTLASVDLVYNTDNSRLIVSPVTSSVDTYSGQAEWIVQVRNNSEFRQFANVWLAKSGGTSDIVITEVWEIDGLENPNTIETERPFNENGVVQLADAVDPQVTRYFRITGEFDHCGPGNLLVASGNSCLGYPTNLGESCQSIAPLDLKYNPVQALLQTTVITQPEAASKPSLCDPLTYRIYINNAGGMAKDLVVTIPLGGIAGLSYVAESVRISGVYPGVEANPALVGLSDEHVNTIGGEIKITIPSESLESLGRGERFYLELQLIAEGCDFISGQRIRFTPSGNNFCGSPITKDRITGVGSSRIIIAGAPDDEPILEISSDASVNVVQVGEALTATYNLTIDNVLSGGGVGYDATGEADETASFVYSFNIKLPADWEILGIPQDIVDEAKAKYVGVDPVKGYVFNFNETLAKESSLSIENIQLVYVGDNPEQLECDTDFGFIQSSAFTKFSPESKCTVPIDCEMELLVTENQTPFVLTIPPAPTGEQEQEFCETDKPTLAGILLEDTSILAWFATTDGTEELSVTTELEVGTRTYYAANRLVDGSVCMSERFAVTVTVYEQPVADVGDDQNVVNGLVFTLDGNDPGTIANTAAGLWEIVEVSDITEAEVDIADPTQYNTTVTIPQSAIGASITLSWTLTNVLCEDVDVVTINSLVNPIEAIDDDYTNIYVNGVYGYPNLGDILGNDILGQITGLTEDDVTIEIVTPATSVDGRPVPIVDTDPASPTFGQVSVPAGTPPARAASGNYTITYRIVEIDNPANYSEAIITVRVNYPELMFHKSAKYLDTNEDGVQNAGDEIEYTFYVENIGDVPVYGDITITDPKLGWEAHVVRSANLPVGSRFPYVQLYTLTQADIDAGMVENSAIVRGEDVEGNVVEADSDTKTRRDGSVVNDPWGEDTYEDGSYRDDPTILDLEQNPSLTFTKSDALTDDEDNNDEVSAGDELTYTFVVTNTGNVTLTGVEITDADLPGISGLDYDWPEATATGTLLPTESVTATATYVVTLDDVNRGFIENQALVNVTTPPSAPDLPETPSDDPETTDDPEDPTRVEVPQHPELELLKEGTFNDTNNDGIAQAGETITYTFTVENTGNVTVDNLTIDDARIGAENLEVTPSTLDPTDVGTASITYTLTQDDVDDGGVWNIATVTGEDPNGNPVTDDSEDPTPIDEDHPLYDSDCEDCTVTPLPQEPSLTFTKSDALTNDADDNGEVSEGDELTYTFVITNTGNVTLTDVTITDADLPGISRLNYDWSEATARGVLLPTEWVTATATYVVTLDDVNRGFIANQALVGVTTPPNAPDLEDTPSDDPETTEPEDPTRVEVPQHPELELLKEGTFNDTNNDGIAQAGETITYTFTVTNTGNVTVDNLTIDDDRIGAENLEVTPSTLDPTDVGTASFTYTLTQDDVDDGGVWNIATVTGDDPNGDPVTDDSEDPTPIDVDHPLYDSDCEDCTVTPLPQEPSLTFTKSDALTNDADNNDEVSEGDEMTYTFVVTNTGNVTLTEVEITDDMAGLRDWTYTWPNATATGTLLPTEWVTATATYTVTLDDVNRGFIANQALVNVTTPPSAPNVPETPSDDPDTEDEPEDPTIVDIPQHPALELLKEGVFNDTNNDGLAQAGETITYSFTVENTGNVTVDNLSIDDARIGVANLEVSPSTLEPGGIGTTASITYTLTQDDVDDGGVWNIATVTGDDPNGDPVTDDSEDPTPIDEDHPLYDSDCEDCTVTPLPQEPSLTFTKSDALTNDADDNGEVSEGDELTYTFVITNTGNVTLTDVTITDADLPGISELDYDWSEATAPGTLLPTELVTATATYVVTLDDVNRGFIANQALVGVTTPPNAPDLPETPSDDPETTEPEDPTRVEVPQHPALELLKEGTFNDTNNDGFAQAGETITYTFTVTNTGNVTVDALSIDDERIGVANLEVSPSTLDPNDVGTASFTYTLTQTDINAGGVWNIATVTGDDPSGNPVRDDSEDPTPIDEGDPLYDPECEDCTVTPLPQNPELTLLKEGTLTDENGDGFAQAGETITYTFTVRNTGNVTVEGLTIDDERIGAVNLVVDPAELDPNEEGTASFTYTLTQTDINDGGVWNIATVTGDDPNGNPVTDDSEDPTPIDEDDPLYDPACEDCTVTPLPQHPALELLKEGVFNDTNNDGLAQAGETITYTFTVTNTGNVTVDNLTIDDDRIGAANLVVNPAELDPNGVGTASITYTLTQDDVDDGGVWNIATVTGDDPNGDPVTDDSEDPTPIDEGDPLYDPECENCTVTPLPQDPSLTFTKSDALTDDADDNGEVSEGDELTYTFVVTNTGNVSLTDVEITDADLPGISELDYDWSEATAPGTLLPTEWVTATATYVVTLNDVNRGFIANQALVGVTTPPNAPDLPETPSDDPETTDPEDPTRVEVSQHPALELLKEGTFNDTNNDGFAQAGETITYTFTVTNTGNVTADALSITDERIGVANLEVSPSTLDPNDVGTASFTYTLTQTDINAGGVWNIATVTGDDPTGNPVRDDSEDPTPIDEGDPLYDPECEDCTVTPLPQNPELTLLKEGTLTDENGDGFAQAGETITYTFTVRNTGNVTVEGLTIDDERIGVANLAVSPSSLIPGTEGSATASYVLTQGDIDDGGVWNIATVTGEDPNGNPVTDDSEDPVPLDPEHPDHPGEDEDCGDCTITPLPSVPAIALVKEVTNVGTGKNGVFVLGDVIEYTFTVTNTGNVTLENFTLTDAKLGITNQVIQGTLVPQASFPYVATYTVTEGDIEAGEVVNTATVTGQSPNGTEVEDVSGTDIDNDTPTVTPVATPPVAEDDSRSTKQSVPVTVDVLTNDEEGSSSLIPSTVRLIDPETGEESMEVTIPGEGTYTVNEDGTITFAPVREFEAGESKIRYVVRDRNGLVSNEATLTITITPTEPEAIDDQVTTEHHTPVNIPILDNDRPDGVPFAPGTVEVVSQPANGTVVINADGSVTYTPNEYFSGSDSFTYRVQDENGNWTNVATVRIDVPARDLRIPNVFTPNGDGRNDYFEIEGIEGFDRIEVTVVNRWGNEVYRNTNYRNNWNGDNLNEGTYYYQIRTHRGGQTGDYTGWVLIKRQ